MSFLKTLSAELGHILALYGGWGLLGISFLDSTFVALPSLNDLLLLHLSSQRPERAPLYALASTAGSLLGSYVMYGLARGGSVFLWKRTSSRALRRAHDWLERHEFGALLVASLLPPPAPFKAFLLAAGALRVNALRFGLALLVGRGTRFGVEAFLGARYGAQAAAYLKANFTWVSLVVVVLVVGSGLLHQIRARRKAAGSRAEAPSSPSALL